jgi:hypothetical protein
MATPQKFVRASAPSNVKDDPLGLLTELPGTWAGKGFNVMSLPVADPSIKFRVKLNAFQETLTFNDIGAQIPNRANNPNRLGVTQPDINLFGLHYLQMIDDSNGEGPLHLETGIWLNVPATVNPPGDPTVVRLASIPHGDSVLAQGPSFVVKSGPQIGIADATPFTLNPTSGARINDTSEPYLAPFKNAELPPGIPAAAVLNPNVLLTSAIAGQTIAKTVVLIVNASPVGGINDSPITPQPGADGGIVNIPFVVQNANANSMSAIFWIEWVQNADGGHFLQLQYTQTVILDFPVIGADGKTMVDIKWPHISVATLIKR